MVWSTCEAALLSRADWLTTHKHESLEATYNSDTEDGLKSVLFFSSPWLFWLQVPPGILSRVYQNYCYKYNSPWAACFRGHHIRSPASTPLLPRLSTLCPRLLCLSERRFDLLSSFVKPFHCPSSCPNHPNTSISSARG